jgi:hypothetical protein
MVMNKMNLGALEDLELLLPGALCPRNSLVLLNDIT